MGGEGCFREFTLWFEIKWWRRIKSQEEISFYLEFCNIF